MIPEQETSMKVLLVPKSVTSAQTVTGFIDCKGYDYAELDFVLDSAGDTDEMPITAKIGEATASNGTYTDIAAFTLETQTAYTQAVTGARIIQNLIDMRGRKRFLKMTLTPQTTTIVCGTAKLSRAGIKPGAATGGIDYRLVG